MTTDEMELVLEKFDVIAEYLADILEVMQKEVVDGRVESD
jgi:hypothetical protein